VLEHRTEPNTTIYKEIIMLRFIVSLFNRKPQPTEPILQSNPDARDWSAHKAACRAARFQALREKHNDFVNATIEHIELEYVARLLMVLCVFATTIAMGQEIHHAPTAEQCHADIAVWKAQNKETIMKLPVQTLLQRSHYLHDCFDVLRDVKDLDGVDWSMMLRKAYEEHALHRAMDFIDRHNLDPQFYDEDAKGAR
jgi:hypothetical protein